MRVSAALLLGLSILAGTAPATAQVEVGDPCDIVPWQTVDNGIGAEPGVVREFAVRMSVPAACLRGGRTWVTRVRIAVTRLASGASDMPVRIALRPPAAPADGPVMPGSPRSQPALYTLTNVPVFPGQGIFELDTGPNFNGNLNEGIHFGDFFVSGDFDGDDTVGQFLVADQMGPQDMACWTGVNGAVPTDLCTNGNPLLSASGFGAGTYTYYGRYAGGASVQGREPLATTWNSRYLSPSPSPSDLKVFRDPPGSPIGGKETICEFFAVPQDFSFQCEMTADQVSSLGGGPGLRRADPGWLHERDPHDPGGPLHLRRRLRERRHQRLERDDPVGSVECRPVAGRAASERRLLTCTPSTGGWSAAYVVFALTAGAVLARRGSGGADDFFLAGRKLPWWLAGTSIVATTFAIDTPLVITGWVRDFGIWKNWLWWCYAITGLVTGFVFARWWRRGAVMTKAEFAELRYGDRGARWLRGFLGALHAGFVDVIGLCWVLLAAAKIVDVLFGVDKVVALAFACAIALAYSLAAGLWGVVVTDFAQFTLSMIGAVVLAVLAWQAIGGAPALWEAVASGAVPADRLAFLPPPGPGTPLEASFWTTPVAALAVYLGLAWFAVESADGAPLTVQRISATRDERQGVLAVVWFAVANNALRPWPWIVVAIASLLVPAPPDGRSAGRRHRVDRELDRDSSGRCRRRRAAPAAPGRRERAGLAGRPQGRSGRCGDGRRARRRDRLGARLRGDAQALPAGRPPGADGGVAPGRLHVDHRHPDQRRGVVSSSTTSTGAS